VDLPVVVNMEGVYTVAYMAGIRAVNVAEY
jgi:hypothetical protein